MHTYRTAPPEALLHRLLLRTAGWVPDDVLAAARAALADGDPEAAARGLAAAAPAVAPNDRTLLRSYGADGAARRSEPPVFTFTPADPQSPELGHRMPPVLDLTTAPERLLELASDAVDRAATGAAASVAGAVALWRAYRGPGTRVYVLELDAPVTALAPATGELMRVLTAAGLSPPLVETYATGSEVPAYQQQARTSGALLWARNVTVPVELARVFDAVDPRTGPSFSDEHEQLSRPDRRRLLRYLDAGQAVLETTELMADVVDRERGAVVPMSYRTDGAYVWPDVVTYYLREHGLAPEPGLVAQARRNGYAVPEIGLIEQHRALAELFRPVGDAPVWTA